MHSIFLLIACAIEGSGDCRCVSAAAKLVAEVLLVNFVPPVKCSQSRLRQAWKQVLNDDDAWMRAAQAAPQKALWGHLFWQGLHDLSTFFTLKTRKSILGVFKLLEFILPCRDCRLHTKQSMYCLRDTFWKASNLADFIDAVIELHNLITLMIHGTKRLIYCQLPKDASRAILTQTQALKFVAEHGRSSR